MKYIRENKSLVALFVIVQLLIILLIMLGVKVTKDEPEAGKYLLLMASAVAAGFELGSLVLLNHGCSKIWYDHNTQELCRKGWLWGRKCHIPLSEIDEIIITAIPATGLCYIVIEKGKILRNVWLKSKTLAFVCSKENTEFVESFWHNFIPTVVGRDVNEYKN